MRCFICDYSPDVPSILNDSLTDGNRPRKLIEQPDGLLVCELCEEFEGEMADEAYRDAGHSPYAIDKAWDK